jgi:two-component system chemotaxis sensor kinase CheA
MTGIDLSRFKAVFFEESAEHLETMERALLQLEEDPSLAADLLGEIFRAAHSIKGSSGTLGFDDILRFTHAVETLLDKMRGGLAPVTPDAVDLLLRATDVMAELLDVAKDESGRTPQAMGAVLAAVDAAIESVEGLNAAGGVAPQGVVVDDDLEADGARRVWRIRFEPSPDLFRQGVDPLLVLRDLAGLGTVLRSDLDLDRIPAFAELESDTCHLGWTIDIETDEPLDEIRDVFAFAEYGARLDIDEVPLAEQGSLGGTPARSADGEGPAEAVSVVPRASRVAEQASIRVPVEKVDALINLVGEMVIGQSMIAEFLNGSGGLEFDEAGFLERLARLREASAQMGRNTRDLQERVMAIRMVPIATTFQRFPRMVRDVAGALGKKVRVVLSGEETELDKGVVERIGDPLNHLVRNAVDHGLETAEDRRAAGKSETGELRLAAFTEGGNVVIEVKDDGRGLDLDRIRKKAIERGLIGPDDRPTTQQLQAMIFEPAFSTADKVSDLSGRGVGMDVVKRNVEALNGTIQISSEPGVGTCFRIKLPLTLAILDGLTLAIGRETLIVPLLSVVESLRPAREDVQTFQGRGEVVLLRGQAVPLLRLHRVLGLEAEITNPWEGIVVIVEHEGRRVAWLVDRLVSQQQVVVKSLDSNFQRVEHVMGATILGDGSVALILDVGSLAGTLRGRDRAMLAKAT